MFSSLLPVYLTLFIPNAIPLRFTNQLFFDSRHIQDAAAFLLAADVIKLLESAGFYV
jgi:hypothetical protein